MKRDKIMELFEGLAKSQGFYGRLLRDLRDLDEETLERVWIELEAQEFKDEIDLILYLEA
jgi:hypothetical protein